VIKLQKDTTSYTPEWLIFKKKKTILSIGKDLYIVGENAK
jgi:hypothetical protein